MEPSGYLLASTSSTSKKIIQKANKNVVVVRLFLLKFSALLFWLGRHWWTPGAAPPLAPPPPSYRCFSTAAASPNRRQMPSPSLWNACEISILRNCLFIYSFVFNRLFTLKPLIAQWTRWIIDSTLIGRWWIDESVSVWLVRFFNSKSMTRFNRFFKCAQYRRYLHINYR